MTRSLLFRVWAQDVPREGEDDCWVEEAIVETKSVDQKEEETRGDHSTDFWKCASGTGQQVAQLHVS